MHSRRRVDKVTVIKVKKFWMEERTSAARLPDHSELDRGTRNVNPYCICGYSLAGLHTRSTGLSLVAGGFHCRARQAIC